jgi:hypothetical protein
MADMACLAQLAYCAHVESESDPLLVLIAGQPGMADRLMREHADDGSGRCTVCSGGAQSGRYLWPCSIYRAAINARESVL